MGIIAAIDITTEQRKTLLALLRRFIPGVAVWAYGSRVKWTARPNSDLDLVVFTTPAQRHFVSELKEALEESNIPFLVDIHVWDEVPEKFRSNIENEYVVLQEAKRLASDSGMAVEWKLVSIQDVAQKVAMGPFGSSIKVDTFVPEGVPVISGQHLRGRRLDDLDYNFISLEHADKLANANVRRGDVVFTHAGNIGQVAYIPESSKYERYVISQRQFYLRPNTEMVLPEFIVYFFTSAEGQHKLLANTSSSGVPSIAQPVTYLRTIQIPLPPLSEQRSIACVLGALDDKIELNRRMNETLEAMMRATFKSWFVDFDPVRAKAEGRDTGLPQHFADLFPDSFEDSELGKVPAGWFVKRIEDISERIGMGPFGSSIKVETFVPDGVPVISGQHLRGFMLEDNTFNFITLDHAERLRKANVERGDVIFTHAGNIGQVAYIPENSQYKRYVLSQRQFFMRCDRTQVSPIFIAIYFGSPEGRHRLLANTSSSGVPSIAQPVTYLRTIPLTIPPKHLMVAFEKLIQPMLLEYRVVQNESLTLAALRDTLLPKLISGDLRLQDSCGFAKEGTT